MALASHSTSIRKPACYIIPARRVNALNGDITNDFGLADVAFNIELAPERFKVPEGLRAVTFPTLAPVTKHADKILNWIDARKLAVETTIPVHGPPTTIAEFRKAVEEMKVKAN